MEKPRASTIAWLSVPAAIAAYDYLCPKGEQLSERADEWCENPVKRVAVGLAMGALSLHLINAIPEKYDVIHYLLPPKQ